MIHPYIFAGLPARQKVEIMNTENGAVYIRRHIIPAALSVWNNRYEQNYTLKDLKSPWRKREVVECRHVCIYIMRHKANYDLKKIGRIFGGRDHSTIIYACRAVENLINLDKRFNKMVKDVYEEIQTRSIKNAEEFERDSTLTLL
jgi:hypothetical protein